MKDFLNAVKLLVVDLQSTLFSGSIFPDAQRCHLGQPRHGTGPHADWGRVSPPKADWHDRVAESRSDHGLRLRDAAHQGPALNVVEAERTLRGHRYSDAQARVDPVLYVGQCKGT